MWGYLFFVAAGGAQGALCRYGIAGLAARLYGGSFAWGTWRIWRSSPTGRGGG